MGQNAVVPITRSHRKNAANMMDGAIATKHLNLSEETVSVAQVFDAFRAGRSPAH
jgi:hypothetical protein